jgi:hypothetical protein
MARDRVGRSLVTDLKIGAQHGAPFLQGGGRAENQYPSTGSYMEYDRAGISNAFGPSYVPGAGAEAYRAMRPFNNGSVGMNSPYVSDKNREPLTDPRTFIEYSSNDGARAFGKERPRRERA